MKNKKKLLFISLFLNLLFVSGSIFVVYQKGGARWLKEQFQVVSAPSDEFTTHYYQRKDIFEFDSSEDVDKIFAGDSITDHGEFQQFYPNELVLNRGISGDTSAGLLNRIDEIVNRNANEVYILIGTNDVLLDLPLEDYAKNIQAIIDSFNESDTQLYFLSILPLRRDNTSSVNNTNVIEYNQVLEDLTNENNISFINLYPEFIDEEGMLKEDYTLDGIHINGEAYQKGIEIINNR